MKKIVVMMLAAAALLFAACAAKGPEAVAKKAISAIQKGDFEAYAATYDLSKEDQKMLAAMMEEKIGKKFEGNGGIDKYEIVESDIDEDKATVKIHFVFKDGSSEDESMSFKLVDGDWKQDLKK